MKFDGKKVRSALGLAHSASDEVVGKALLDRGIDSTRLEIIERCSNELTDLSVALCGDVEGHEFHGNQHTGGGAGGGAGGGEVKDTFKPTPGVSSTQTQIDSLVHLISTDNSLKPEVVGVVVNQIMKLKAQQKDAADKLESPQTVGDEARGVKFKENHDKPFEPADHNFDRKEGETMDSYTERLKVLDPAKSASAAVHAAEKSSSETGISNKKLRGLKYKPAGGATGFSGKSAYKHFGK